MTEYDYEVIEEWSRGFTLNPNQKRNPLDPMRYEGDWGIQPDVLARIQVLKSWEYRWFHEVVFVGGRRGGKGHIGALCGAYILWAYILKGNVQKFYGVDRDKRLAAIVFAGKRDQAKANQWRDLINVIVGSNCFTGGSKWSSYISRPLEEKLTVKSRRDIFKPYDSAIQNDMDTSTFEIVPKESTTMAGRGPASFMLYFDEMAHMVATGANRGADEVYSASKPSLDQFGADAFLYEGSSPWQMLGQFYENWLHSLEVYGPDSPEVAQNKADAYDPIYPEIFMVQLASWDIYKDWERATEIPLVPPEIAADNPFYQMSDGSIRTVRPLDAPIVRPIQQYDEAMQREERANPDTFRVERKAKWAAALDAYLDPDAVARMFQNWPEDRELFIQRNGVLSGNYIAHGDPSISGANFGWAIAHAEGPDENGLLHVVFDVLHAWEPSSFEDNKLDYLVVERDICAYIDAFMPGLVTFDQFSSAPLMAHLREHIRKRQYPKNIMVDERTATKPQNWAMAECFKTALNMGLIHAPYSELLELELTFLQVKGDRVDHPTSGPVQTKDVADAVFNVVWALIGKQMSAFLSKSLSDLELTGGMEGGMAPSYTQDTDVFQQFTAFRGGRAQPPDPSRMASTTPEMMRKKQMNARPGGWGRR